MINIKENYLNILWMKFKVVKIYKFIKNIIIKNF